MNTPTIEQIIERVNAWQEAGFVHPMTCPYHSDEKLVPIETKNGVCLVCLRKRCSYKQGIPTSIMELDPQILKDEKEKLIKQGFKF